jgi:hypothetical protein
MQYDLSLKCDYGYLILCTRQAFNLILTLITLFGSRQWPEEISHNLISSTYLSFNAKTCDFAKLHSHDFPLSLSLSLSHIHDHSLLLRPASENHWNYFMLLTLTFSHSLFSLSLSTSLHVCGYADYRFSFHRSWAYNIVNCEYRNKKLSKVCTTMKFTLYFDLFSLSLHSISSSTPPPRQLTIFFSIIDFAIGAAFDQSDFNSIFCLLKREFLSCVWHLWTFL